MELHTKEPEVFTRNFSYIHTTKLNGSSKIKTCWQTKRDWSLAVYTFSLIMQIYFFYYTCIYSCTRFQQLHENFENVFSYTFNLSLMFSLILFLNENYYHYDLSIIFGNVVSFHWISNNVKKLSFYELHLHNFLTSHSCYPLKWRIVKFSDVCHKKFLFILRDYLSKDWSLLVQ